MLFPFGPYKGILIRDIPAAYLDWFDRTPRVKEFPEIQNWIADNRDAIDTEMEMLQGIPA